MNQHMIEVVKARADEFLAQYAKENPPMKTETFFRLSDARFAEIQRIAESPNSWPPHRANEISGAINDLIRERADLLEVLDGMRAFLDGEDDCPGVGDVDGFADFEPIDVGINARMVRAIRSVCRAGAAIDGTEGKK